MRSLIAIFLLATLSLSQQPPTLTPALRKRIEHHVRQYVELSPEARVTLGAMHAAEFPGYSAIAVTIEDQGKTRTSDFLISRDGDQMLYLSRFDLRSDPYDVIMSKIDLRG